MDVKIAPSWKEVLKDEFEKPYFNQLTDFVRSEYAQYKVFPRAKNIFAAFDRCSFDDLKVVIVGQDPYHDDNQAHGLCFSVEDGTRFPPSLNNIFTEIESDLGLPRPVSGDLGRWADQGVLLLNSVLTVRAHSPASHAGHGWEQFTDAVIGACAQKTGVVYMLWGAYSQRKCSIVDQSRNCVLKSVHPSPLSAYRGFMGCRHFSQANSYLESQGASPIRW